MLLYFLEQLLLALKRITASAVNIFGHIIGDYEAFKTVKPSTSIIITKSLIKGGGGDKRIKFRCSRFHLKIKERILIDENIVLLLIICSLFVSINGLQQRIILQLIRIIIPLIPAEDQTYLQEPLINI